MLGAFVACYIIVFLKTRAEHDPHVRMVLATVTLRHHQLFRVAPNSSAPSSARRWLSSGTNSLPRAWA